MTENENILAGLLKNAHSWTDLKPLLSNYNTSETEKTKKNTKAGKLFELFAKFCFEHDVNFKEEYNIKQAFLYEELTDELKQRLRIGDIEHGIDLILLNHDDQTIAVQCKFKNDEEVKLSWNSEKLGNFFGFAKNANYHIVFSNSSDITDVAKNLTEDFKFLGYSYLRDISSETFQSIRNALINKTEAPIKKAEPREYQLEAITAVVNHFKENDRGQLILPCGAGKTLTSLWIKEALQATNTLVLVPSLALLRQIKKEWNKSFNKQFIRLNVCSEKDIDNDKNVENDSLIVHTYEIPGNVTSDKNIIAEFLKQPNNKVVFSTYQSLQAVVNALEILPDFRFDLVLADEAHKTAGFEDQNKFTLVHNAEKLRSSKRLYMTATPRIASSELKALHKERLKYLKDMSNPKDFGKEAYRMTFGTAIEKGILVNYKIIAVGVSDSDLKKNIDKNIILTKTERIIDYAHNYALNIAMEKYNAYHALTFHSRVKLAFKFAERHPKLVANISATSISGEQTTSEREKILDNFKASARAVVSNARCLTEGVDVPIIDMVYYGDPKNSKIDIVQSAGRALRKGGNKAWGYIVVPIFHKDKQTVEEAIDKSQYKNLITVIRSLCDQDERLEAEINELAWDKENKSAKGTIEFTFSDDDTDKVIQFEKIQEKLKNSLFNQIIDNLKDPWEIHYKQLEEYYKEYGHSDIPARHKHKGFALGTWAVAQRTEFRKNRLSEREIKLLKKLNFEFEPVDFYKDFIIELRAYYENFGNVNVPTQHKDFLRLGRSVNKVRTLYSQGKRDKSGNIVAKGKGTLLKSEIDELNSLGFVWMVRKDNWEDNFLELQEYFNKNGHSSVKMAENVVLYYWRYGIIRRQKNLSEERKKKLASINFEYLINKNSSNSNIETQDISEINLDPGAFEKQWEEMFERLKSFVKTNDHFLISKSTPENKQLSSWAITQRIANKKKRLSPERIDKLNEIQFPWTLPKGRKRLNDEINTEQKNKTFDAWDKYYMELLNYKLKNGHSNVPKQYHASSLAQWVSRQRYLNKKQKLSQEQIEKLNLLDFQWGDLKTDFQKKIWLKSFEKLKEVYTTNGNSTVTKSYHDKQLATWVLQQRHRRKKGNLKQEFIDLLDSLKFDWNPESKGGSPDDEQWFEMLKQLEAYKIKFGNCNVSQLNVKYKKLGRWLNDQRLRYSKEKLFKHRKELLNDIGVVWNINEFDWEVKFNDLKKYFNQHGHFDVNQSDNDYKGLYNWLYKIKKNGIPEEKKKLFDDIGFEFIDNKRSNWFDMFSQLAKFKETNGHTNIPIKYSPNQELAKWVLAQKVLHRKNELDKDKLDILNAIGFQWTKEHVVYNTIINARNPKNWHEMFEKLKNYKLENGNFDVPKKYPKDQDFSVWLYYQKQLNRDNKLSEEKTKAFSEIEFEFPKPMENQLNWDERFEELLQFQKKNGHCRIPVRYKENQQLATWVRTQRRGFTEGTIDPDKKRKLESVGFIWKATE